jgi:DNA polymerase III sliding clamp (beta) subunit (PCNA family)
MNALSFRIDRNSLADALKQAARVTEKRNTIPILSYVLFDVGRDIVRLEATDLDILLTCELPAAAETEGRLCVPLAVLKDAIGKLKAETVTIEDMGNGKAVLTGDGSSARVILGTMKADDWPSFMKPGDMLADFSMPAETLGAALGSVMPFASSEETRYYLMGAFVHAACSDYSRPRTEEHEKLCEERSELQTALSDALREAGPAEGREPEAQAKLEAVRDSVNDRIAEIDAAIAPLEAERCKPDVLRFATTDGHRLGRYTLPLPEGAEGLLDMILPSKAATLVYKHLIGRKPVGDVRVRVNATKAEFTYGRFRVLAKQIDGTFPDYTRVIPCQPTHRLTVPAAELADAIGSVSAIASVKNRGVALSISKSDGLILTCSSPENGRAAAIFDGAFTYDADDANGASLAIGFNVAYLSAFLSACPGDAVFGFTDTGGPARIESPDRPEFLGVLMPMRVDSCVTTRADVEALTMNPWESLRRKAQNGDFAKLEETIAASDDKSVRSAVRNARYDAHIAPAITHLVANGEPRHLARLAVAIELEYGRGGFDSPDADALLRLQAGYQRQPEGGGFKALSFREAADPGAQDPAALDPATAEAEVETIATSDAAVIGADQPSEDSYSTVPDKLETVAAQGQVSDQPEAEQVLSIVKVLTVTDQAVFVSRVEWECESIDQLMRFNRDGSRMKDRRILRSNLKRLVPPRNRGDRPIEGPKASNEPPKASNAVEERLARLERIVAGVALAERPKRSEAQLRALRAYLKLRQLRVAYASRVRDAEAYEARWLQTCKSRRQEAERRVQAEGERDALKVRCDALERLHADSGPLDTAAAGLNGKPAIILPAVRTSVRAS